MTRFVIQVTPPLEPTNLKRSDRLRFVKVHYAKIRDALFDVAEAQSIALEVEESSFVPYLFAEGPENLPEILSSVEGVESISQDQS